ncbi:MAG: VOC family protein [Steroidobacteraceae bacterium]|nr:VOC family protein [Steroidobacteraceae bacterium]
MTPIISDLVQRYETGRLSRRELIQGLAALVAAGSARAQDSAPEGLVAEGIDHTSVFVSDLERSAQFYQSLFDLRPLGEDKEHKILRLGRKRVIVSLRQASPAGMIDHFGVKVQNFRKDEVTRILKKRGLTPEDNWEYGYHVRDPDGAVVQMI